MTSPRGKGMLVVAALCLIAAAACLLSAAAENARAGSLPPPVSYKLEPSASSAWPYYDAAAEIARYAAVAYESYKAAGDAAGELQDAVTALLDEPTDAALAAARGAWLKARAAFMATEGFRFYGGPIDGALHRRIDPWPVDEAFIEDMVGDPKIAITRQTLIPPVGGDPSHAVTGFHVIEFLLWGQDKNPGSATARLAADFQVGGPRHADRRRQFLQTAVKLLVEDIGQLTAAWAPQTKGNYAAQFLALDPREALGRMLAGMAILADQAIAQERLMAALDDRIRLRPLDRYSLHTNDDLTADLDGIRILWTGDDRQSYGTGLDGLVQSLDPALALQMDMRLAAAQSALRLLDKPFDHLLSAPPGSDGWTHVSAAAAAFHGLARTIQDIGKLLAVRVPLSAP